MHLRNLELSFWWAVNQYEAMHVLAYACQRTGGGDRSGRVTIFAATAEWKRSPSVFVVSALDETSMGELLRLRFAVTAEGPQPRAISVLHRGHLPSGTRRRGKKLSASTTSRPGGSCCGPQC